MPLPKFRAKRDILRIAVHIWRTRSALALLSATSGRAMTRQWVLDTGKTSW